MVRLPIIALCVLCGLSAGAESLPEGDVCGDGSCDSSQASALLQFVKGETSNSPNEVRLARDNCPYTVAEPVSLNQATPWNVTAELPEALFMKHAGWSSDFSDRGIGVFAARSFKKGQDIGSAPARVAHCDDQASIETPMGLREIRCDIHLFDLPEGSGNSDDDLAVFPSWMSFLNYPDGEGEGGPEEEGNVEWVASTCGHPSGAPQWRLVASEDIAPLTELSLVYDSSSSASPAGKMRRKKGPPGPAPAMKMMKKMGAGKMKLSLVDDDSSSASSATKPAPKKGGTMKAMKKMKGMKLSLVDVDASSEEDGEEEGGEENGDGEDLLSEDDEGEEGESEEDEGEEDEGEEGRILLGFREDEAEKMGMKKAMKGSMKAMKAMKAKKAMKKMKGMKLSLVDGDASSEEDGEEEGMDESGDGEDLSSEDEESEEDEGEEDEGEDDEGEEGRILLGDGEDEAEKMGMKKAMKGSMKAMKAMKAMKMRRKGR